MCKCAIETRNSHTTNTTTANAFIDSRNNGSISAATTAFSKKNIHHSHWQIRSSLHQALKDISFKLIVYNNSEYIFTFFRFCNETVKLLLHKFTRYHNCNHYLCNGNGNAMDWLQKRKNHYTNFYDTDITFFLIILEIN